MWNFLKADLQELVAVVKEDAASLGIPVVEGNADSDITTNTGRNENLQPDEGTKFYNSDHDTQKSSAQMEAERRMNIPETFTVPLLPKKFNRSSSKNDTEIIEEELQENLDSQPIVNESAESATHIVKDSTKHEGDDEGIEDTDAGDGDDVEIDEYEVQHIQEYLKTFNINYEQIQQDIAYLLEEYKQTLRIQYENLVPDQVSHEEFWERYFYRCDATRIEMEWDGDEEDQEQRAREGPRRGAKIVTSVTSFFGDAARAVATGMSNALTEDLQSFDNDDDVDDTKDGKEISSTARGLATSLFGHTASSHRPPFVMNTAVDEDDGEEEEEIGWDDDDEDEDDEEQIVFDDNVGGPVMSTKQKRSTVVDENKVNQEGFDKNDSEVALLCEQLKEQLKQAIEERDILHQTVSLQTKEIATLKSVSATATDESKNSSSDNATEIARNDRTNTNDGDDKVQVLQNQVQELSDMILDRDNQILEMKNQYETDCKALQERVLEFQNSNNQLQQEIQDMERTTSIERNNIIETMQQLEAEKNILQEQLQTAQSDVAASQTKIIHLQTELETLQEQLKLANESIKIMSQPVATTGIDESMVTDATTNMSSSGELTTATGVKVAVPSPPQPPSTVVSKISSNNDEEEEGWGDDWD